MDLLEGLLILTQNEKLKDQEAREEDRRDERPDGKSPFAAWPNGKEGKSWLVQAKKSYA